MRVLALDPVDMALPEQVIELERLIQLLGPFRHHYMPTDYADLHYEFEGDTAFNMT